MLCIYRHTHHLIPLKVQCDTYYLKRNSEIMTFKRPFFFLSFIFPGYFFWSGVVVVNGCSCFLPMKYLLEDVGIDPCRSFPKGWKLKSSLDKEDKASLWSFAHLSYFRL